MNIILNVSLKEKLNLSLKEMITILDKSENNIYNTMWLLEMKKFNVNNDTHWTNVLDKIVDMIICKDNYNTANMFEVIKQIRELLYVLFITNIDFHIVIRKLMFLLTNKLSSIIIKHKIIEITSQFDMRLAKGTRYIIHMEAYIIKIINLLNNIN
jgi:hypothetical protein